MNWRTVTIDGVNMQVLLPCNFKQVVQNITIDALERPLTLYGCTVDNKLFAVSVLPLDESDVHGVRAQEWQNSLVQKTLSKVSIEFDKESIDDIWGQLVNYNKAEISRGSYNIKLLRKSKPVRNDWEDGLIDELNLTSSGEVVGMGVDWTGIWGGRKVAGKKYLLHAVVIGDAVPRKEIDDFFDSVINYY